MWCPLPPQMLCIDSSSRDPYLLRQKSSLARAPVLIITECTYRTLQAMKKDNSYLKSQSEQSAREVCHLQEELRKTKQSLSQSQNLAEDMRGECNYVCSGYFSKLMCPGGSGEWRWKLL